VLFYFLVLSSFYIRSVCCILLSCLVRNKLIDWLIEMSINVLLELSLCSIPQIHPQQVELMEPVLVMFLCYTVGNWPGIVITARLEWTVRIKRRAMFDAFTRCPSTRGSRTSRQPHGRWPSSRIHGSHTDLPGTSGKTQGSPRGLGWIQLPQGSRAIHFWSVCTFACTGWAKKVSQIIFAITLSTVIQFS